MKAAVRCPWCPLDDPLYVKYHDEEWGIPQHDGKKLFEMLNLEGAQAGLSWKTILHKRENYRREFEGFDAEKLSRWKENRITKALQNPGIVRNQLKVRGVVRNAQAFLTHFDGDPKKFSAFLWNFVGGKPIQNRPRSMSDVPSSTEISDAMSRALKKMGFTFVGSTICYAFMQAVGMVCDHVTNCAFAKEKGKRSPKKSA